MLSLCTLFLLVLGLTYAAHSAHAYSCTFTSTEPTNDFSLPANWTDCGGSAPSLTDDILIPMGEIAELTVFSNQVNNANVSGTILGTDKNLVIMGDTYIDVTGFVTSTSGLINFNGSTFRNDGLVGTNSGTIVNNNNGTNNGTIDIGAGQFNTWILTNNGTVNGGSGLIRMDAYGASWVNAGAGVLNPQVGTVRVGGIAVQQLPFPTLYNLHIPSGPGGIFTTSTVITNSLTIDAGGALHADIYDVDIFGAGTNAIDGTLDTDSGSIVFATGTTAIAGTLESLGSGHILIESGNFSIDPGGVVTSTSGSLVFQVPFTSAGEIGNSTGDIWFQAAFVNGGTVNLGSGTATATAAVNNTGGTFNGGSATFVILDDFSGGVFNPQTGLVHFQTPGSSIQMSDFHDILFSGGVSYTMTNPSYTVTGSVEVATGTSLMLMSDTGLSVAGRFVVAGTFNLQSGHATTTGEFIITSTGEFENAGGGMPDVIEDNLTVVGSFYNGGALSCFKNCSFKLYSHLINNGSSLNTSNIDFLLLGNDDQAFPGLALLKSLTLRKTGGNAIISATTTISHSLVVESGALNMLSSDLFVQGTSTIGVAGVVTSTSGWLTFYGAVTSTGAIGSIAGKI